MAENTFNISQVFKSETKTVRCVEPMIHTLKQKFAIPDDLYYNILVAVTEAINNGIIHGNKCDSEKTISFNVHADAREIVITVADQGAGFDYDNVNDPRDPENILKENGRGVFLIRRLADFAEYTVSNSGTTVKMVFLLHP